MRRPCLPGLGTFMTPPPTHTQLPLEVPALWFGTWRLGYLSPSTSREGESFMIRASKCLPWSWVWGGSNSQYRPLH